MSIEQGRDLAGICAELAPGQEPASPRSADRVLDMLERARRSLPEDMFGPCSDVRVALFHARLLIQDWEKASQELGAHGADPLVDRILGANRVLVAQVEGLQRSLDFSADWHAKRYEQLAVLLRNTDLWKQAAAIIANGCSLQVPLPHAAPMLDPIRRAQRAERAVGAILDLWRRSRGPGSDQQHEAIGRLESLSTRRILASDRSFLEDFAADQGPDSNAPLPIDDAELPTLDIAVVNPALRLETGEGGSTRGAPAQLHTRYLDSLSIDKLDSLTKYPSIPELHVAGDRGRLKDEVQVVFPEGSDLEITEKIDGVNARIIVMPDGEWVIGSRNELLGAMRDAVRNPAHGIIEAVRSSARLLGVARPAGILVAWCEVYGGSGPNAVKRAGCYTSRGSVGVRIFDSALWPADEAQALLDKSHDYIAGYRQRGQQPFHWLADREQVAGWLGLDLVPVITRHGSAPPASLSEAEAFLKRHVPVTFARLDDGTCTSGAEGIVLRTPDRKYIAKMRFDDYRRTLAPEPTPRRR